MALHRGLVARWVSRESSEMRVLSLRVDRITPRALRGRSGFLCAGFQKSRAGGEWRERMGGTGGVVKSSSFERCFVRTGDGDARSLLG